MGVLRQTKLSQTQKQFLSTRSFSSTRRNTSQKQFLRDQKLILSKITWCAKNVPSNRRNPLHSARSLPKFSRPEMSKHDLPAAIKYRGCKQ
eukprot:289044-Prymnesium_polylepis.1